MNKMVKKAVNVALFASMAAAASVASAEGISGQYINAQLAVSELGTVACNAVTCSGFGAAYDFDNGLSFVGTYGISIPAVHKYFGIEAEVSKSIMDPEYNSAWGWTWAGTHAEYDYYTAGAYAVATIPVMDKLNVRARAGLAYNHWTITTNQCATVWTGFGWYTPPACSYGGSNVNPSVSGGVTYDFNPNVNFLAELTAWDVDQGNYHVSAGAQIKF